MVIFDAAATVPETDKLLKLFAVTEQLTKLLLVEQVLPTIAVKYCGKVTPIKLPAYIGFPNVIDNKRVVFLFIDELATETLTGERTPAETVNVLVLVSIPYAVPDKK